MHKTIDLNVFAKRLSGLLDESDETTYSLSSKLGLTPATISRYANALMKPKVPTVVSMAQIFNVNEAWLMGLDVPMERNDKQLNNIDEKMIIEKYNKLNKKQKENLLDYANFLLQQQKDK